jgi:sirohydrochlorin cobaltochelatase
MAHGSRHPQWSPPFEALLRKLREGCGEDAVQLAYMENAHPLLAEVMKEAVAKGFSRFHILPLLMSSGVHMAEDIPAQTAQLSQQYPGVSIKILPPIGSHPRFADLLLRVVSESIPAPAV